MHKCVTCWGQTWGLPSWPGGGDRGAAVRHMFPCRDGGAWRLLGRVTLSTRTVFAVPRGRQVAVGTGPVGDEARRQEQDSRMEKPCGRWLRGEGFGQRHRRGCRSVSAGSQDVVFRVGSPYSVPTLLTSLVSSDLFLPLLPALRDISCLLWR